MAKSIDLKLLGLEYGVDDEVMCLPEGGFVAVYDDDISAVLYKPDRVVTLDLYDKVTDTHFSVYKIFNGLAAELWSPHVKLTENFPILASDTEIVNANKVAIIKRLDEFPVPEWEEVKQ